MTTELDVRFTRVLESIDSDSLDGSLDLVDVRRVHTSAMAVIQVERTPWQYGLAIDLLDTRRTFFFDSPVDSFDDWLLVLPAHVSAAFSNDITFWGARAKINNLIELRLTPPWPRDPAATFSGCDGEKETAFIRSAHGSGQLTNLGTPHIGRDQLELRGRTTSSALVELFRWALVRASERGLTRVTTDIDAPELDVLGFANVNGRRVAPTYLLNADQAAAQQVIDHGRRRVHPKWARQRR